MDELGYEIVRTILIELEEEHRQVKIRLKNGEEIVGYTDVIVYDDVDPDDDDNYEEIASIRFLPIDEEMARYFTEDEIDSYEDIG